MLGLLYFTFPYILEVFADQDNVIFTLYVTTAAQGACSLYVWYFNETKITKIIVI